MALPNILLRGFQANTISDWIPGRLAQTYKVDLDARLVGMADHTQDFGNLTFGVLEKDPQEWLVHFHLEDGTCEGKVLPFLWNSGGYFDEGCMKDGKLHLFAHFENKGAQPSRPPEPRHLRSNWGIHASAWPPALWR